MIASYYDLKITGKDVKRFIHNLHKMHIELLNIEFTKNSVIIKVSEVNYRRILAIKTIYEIEVVKVYGIAYLKYFIKKYLFFLIMIILGFIFFLGLTNIIFNIEVVHNNKDLRELILEELESEGIKKYNFVVSFKNKEKIKKNILKKHKDKIDWLEIERVGTKYIIKVEERKKSDVITNNTPRNIIAKKNGLIKKIISTSGEIMVKKDQYVKAGDILIGGIIHNKEEEMARLKAEGTIYAETWYTVTVELPYHYHEEIKTGSKQKILKCRFLNNEIDLFNFKNYKNTQNNNIFSIKNSILPFSISIIEEEEVEVIDKVYTKDNAIIEADTIARKHLKDKLESNIEILYEKKLKITEEDSKIIVVMFYKVYEDITDYQEIPEVIENNETEPQIEIR